MIKDLLEEIKHCRKCLLRNTARVVVVGSGNPDANILIVGEAPGVEEDKQGIPFVGRSGQLFRESISSILDLENDVFITNVVMCRPPNNRITNEHIEYCSGNFWKLVRSMQPDKIITLGRTSFESIILEKIEGGILEATGIVRKIQLNKKIVNVFPMVHPAWVIRNREENMVEWLVEIEGLKNFLQN